MKFRQYSVVRIEHLHRTFDVKDGCFGERSPQVGDVATIVEVYEQPHLGYELECSDSEGMTVWLATFSPNDADLELIA